MLLRVGFLALLAGLSAAAPPTVELDSAIATGVSSSDGKVHKFLGIPFASPPVGPLRFRPSEPLPPYKLPINATAYGPSCPQQKASSPFSSFSLNMTIGPDSGLVEAPGPESEDCLTLNIIKPSFITAADKFPVVAWIHGGGFHFGDTASYDQQGERLVRRSVELGSPVIFVSMNYRVSAFGFLGGQEVAYEGVGNLGLVDQRIALRWASFYIQQFGGDSSQVMLWGQSAGSISVALQMLAYDGDTGNYFQSAFMQSGATIPVGSILNGQPYYDFLTQETNCSSSSDTLNCLRGVPYADLKAAVDKTPNVFSYQSLALAWMPRTDGLFLIQDPFKQVALGLVSKMPIVVGDCDDEGTMFALSSRNVTSEADFRDYVSEIFLPAAPAEELEPLWSYYTANPSDGSPFSTGNASSITPQFKRMAAFQGDAVFQAPRRYFLQNLSGKQKMWSFLSKRVKGIPVFGSFHASDLILQVMTDYVVNFAANHDPNNATGLHWPEYTTASPQLYTFRDFLPTVITLDNFREKPMEYLTNMSLAYPM